MSYKCCCKRVSLGHGAVAICGENFYGEKFVCDKCKIATQADQIKLLRQKLIDANSWLSIDPGYKGSPLMVSVKEVLKQTEGE